jgi:hypothetical protein
MMPIPGCSRLWRRLFPSVMLMYAVPCPAADLRVGWARDAYIRAVAVADNKLGLAVFVMAEGVSLTPSIVDVASARLERDFGMERSSLLFLGTKGETSTDSAVAITDRLYSVAGAALHNLAPARVSEAQVVPGGTARELTGPIRASFTIIDLGLMKPRSYPVQAIRFGRTFIVVALGGEPEVNVPPGAVILKNANGITGRIDDSEGHIADAIRLLLDRKNY